MSQRFSDKLEYPDFTSVRSRLREVRNESKMHSLVHQRCWHVLSHPAGIWFAWWDVFIEILLFHIWSAGSGGHLHNNFRILLLLTCRKTIEIQILILKHLYLFPSEPLLHISSLLYSALDPETAKPQTQMIQFSFIEAFLWECTKCFRYLWNWIGVEFAFWFMLIHSLTGLIAILS